MSYDIFISYARKDNTEGRVNELVEQIKVDYRSFTGEGELNLFFDQTDIHGADDWRHRILQGLRESRLLLAFLSPSYLASEYCAWEFNEYLNDEASRALLGEGIAAVYFVEVPGWSSRDFERQSGEWIAELRRRQRFDLRPWFTEGTDALRQTAVQAKMAELNTQLHQRLDRNQKFFDARGNIDRHNERFSGRVVELRRLREAAGLGKVGTLAIVHGLGGVGKTALAIEYAHAFAYEYPGGRWQLKCEGQENLLEAIGSLRGMRDLAFEFTEAEKGPDAMDRRFERVLQELKLRANAARPGRVLLILDNVDEPKFLEPAQIQRLPQADWIDFIATTRLGPAELFGNEKDRVFVAVDELPEEDAIRLFENYQPGKQFRSETERAAAKEIVQRLGGFTLAVEAAAVFLGDFDDVSCESFATRLKQGLSALEGASGPMSGGLRHGETSLRATLELTFQQLNEAETMALSYAAVLPADRIALPWLRALVAAQFPEFARDAQPGYPDPWKTLLRHLLSRRLLQSTTMLGEDGQPLMLRIHRLVQDAIVSRMDSETREKRRQAVLRHAQSRAAIYWVDPWQSGIPHGIPVWKINRDDPSIFPDILFQHFSKNLGWTTWEVELFKDVAWQFLGSKDVSGTNFANWAFAPLLLTDTDTTGYCGSARDLISTAYGTLEPHDPQEISRRNLVLAALYTNMSATSQLCGNFGGGRTVLEKARGILTNQGAAGLPILAATLHNLAMIAEDEGQLAEAEDLRRQSRTIDSSIAKPT